MAFYIVIPFSFSHVRRMCRVGNENFDLHFNSGVILSLSGVILSLSQSVHCAVRDTVVVVARAMMRANVAS